MANAIADPRIALDPALENALELVANVVIDAIEWQYPEASLAVQLGRPADAPEGVEAGASAERIWLSEAKLSGFDNPETPHVLVNLVWDLHCLVGAAIAQQHGLVSEGLGVAVVEAVGSYAQYRRLIAHGQLDADMLQIPEEQDAMSVGKVAGWAAAGDQRAVLQVRSLAGSARELAESIIEGLLESPPGPAETLLKLATRAPT